MKLRCKKNFLMILSFFCGISSLYSQKDTLWSIESCLTYSHFEQQIKSKIGDPRGQRLSDITEFGIWLQVNRKLWKNISVGIYSDYDIGTRNMAKFSGFDSLGKTQVVNSLGGNYSEFWIGPLLQFSWKNAFCELGYGIVGIRNDQSRNDIQSVSGATSGSFSLNPKVAWYIGIGAKVPLVKRFSLIIRMQYRGRYYDKREGEPFVDNIEHGTQNISPFAGLRYSF